MADLEKKDIVTEAKTDDSTTQPKESKDLDELKGQVADAYIGLIDKTKGWLFALAAELGVSANPMKVFAKEYLLGEAAKKDKDESIRSKLGNNLKQKLLGQADAQLPTLAYDQKELSAMKSLISKSSETELTDLLTMIQDGKDPTKEKVDTPAVAPVVAPVIAVVWAGIGVEKLTESKPYIFPLKNDFLTSPKWPRGKIMHPGIDIWWANKEIKSIGHGVVESVGFGGKKWFNGYGNYMVVKLDNGNRALYGHMSKPAQNADGTAWKIGDEIKTEDQIWIMGNTWYSVGEHLHLEIRKWEKDDEASFFAREIVDPLTVISVTKAMVTPAILPEIDKDLLAA